MSLYWLPKAKQYISLLLFIIISFQLHLDQHLLVNPDLLDLPGTLDLSDLEDHLGLLDLTDLMAHLDPQEPLDLLVSIIIWIRFMSHFTVIFIA